MTPKGEGFRYDIDPNKKIRVIKTLKPGEAPKEPPKAPVQRLDVGAMISNVQGWVEKQKQKKADNFRADLKIVRGETNKDETKN